MKEEKVNNKKKKKDKKEKEKGDGKEKSEGKEKDEGKEAEKGPFKNMLPWWTLSCRFDIKSERSSIYAKDTA